MYYNFESRFIVGMIWEYIAVSLVRLYKPTETSFNIVNLTVLHKQQFNNIIAVRYTTGVVLRIM